MTSLIAASSSIPLNAQSFVSNTEYITNSVVLTLLATGVIVYWAWRATRRMELVPSAPQNLFEALVEVLYDMFDGIVGHHMAKRVFCLLASLFVFILIANWCALLPGVGSIGWGHPAPGILPFAVDHVDVPLLRPTTADMNMTLAMAAVFMVLWLWWSLAEMGVGGFLSHIFGVKGGLKGMMALMLAPIFLFVGVIEVISIMFRPLSLSLRLYGNVFAGENLLVTMLTLGKQFGFPNWLAYLSSVILPLPFYFLEILIGLLQAVVFALLCAVYIQLSTTHDEAH